MASAYVPHDGPYFWIYRSSRNSDTINPACAMMLRNVPRLRAARHAASVTVISRMRGVDAVGIGSPRAVMSSTTSRMASCAIASASFSPNHQ